MRAALRQLVRVGFVAAAVALVLVLPHWLSDPRAGDFARAGVFFVAILGLNLLTGYTGQISLGHGALMALGAYTTAVLVAHHGFRDVATIPLAGLLAGAAGFAIGLPALRLAGLYLALATFALGVAMPSLLKKFSGITGGGQGLNLFTHFKQLTGSTGPIHVLGHQVTQNDFFYYLTWGVGLVLAAVAWLLVRGRLGRAFQAIRDSEVAAASSGVNLALYKTLAFAISGFYAGVAGSLLAIHDEFVNPQSYGFGLSLLLIVGAVVGGLGSLGGLAVGALFLQFLPDGTQWLGNHVGGVFKETGVPGFVFGAAIILIMLVLPGGAGGLLRRLTDPLTSRLYTRS